MQNIKRIISGADEAGSVNEQLLIKLCIDIAEAYLRTKSKKHSFLLSLATSSLRDFAIDCIADLFERRNNKLVVFERWIPKNDIEAQSNGELFIKLRRLVFSKVNDHLFDSYRNYDPSLGKIIRNLKRGVKSGGIEGLAISESGDTIFLTYGNKEGLNISHELFYVKFSARFSMVSTTIDALQKLREIFENLEEYTCKIHITSFALIIREHYKVMNEEEISHYSEPNLYLNGETESVISKQVEQTKKDLYSTYVFKNKLSDSDFSGYFIVVQNILISTFKETKDSGKSHFEHFKNVYHTIEKEEYRNHHRKFLEYFVKKAREDVILFLRKENNSANRPIG